MSSLSGGLRPQLDHLRHAFLAVAAGGVDVPQPAPDVVPAPSPVPHSPSTPPEIIEPPLPEPRPPVQDPIVPDPIGLHGFQRFTRC